MSDTDDNSESPRIAITIDEFTPEFKEAMQTAFDKALAQRLIEKIFEGDDGFAVGLRRRLTDAGT